MIMSSAPIRYGSVSRLCSTRPPRAVSKSPLDSIDRKVYYCNIDRSPYLDGVLTHGSMGHRACVRSLPTIEVGRVGVCPLRNGLDVPPVSLGMQAARFAAQGVQEGNVRRTSQ